MRSFLYFCVLLCSAVPALPADSEVWQPVTQQDLQMKDVPGNPGAPAVQLYYADLINENDHTEFIYERIKVLNDAGRKYANVEIAFSPFRKVKFLDLQARTILPDGRIVEFTGEAFDKLIVKGRRFKYQVKTFTLPEVTVGSILEYKYTIQDKQTLQWRWLVQHPLFTVREHFGFAYPASWTMSYDLSPGFTAKPVESKGRFDLQMQDVAAFEPEEQMPPEDQYKFRVRFFYGLKELLSMRVNMEMGAPIYYGMEEYMKPHKEIYEAAEQAVGNESDPEVRLRKLYARVQQIRNLSHERKRTESEQKKEQLQRNKSVLDVLKHGYGDRDDITMLFVTMARSVGFQADVLLVAGREERIFDDKLPELLQVNSKIAYVQVGSKNVFLDPGTKFCPYGLLRWTHTSTRAVKLAAYSTRTVTTPSPLPGDFMISRTGDMALTEDGTLKGTLIVEYRRGEALEHRLEALDTDDAGRSKQLEDEVKAWLPANVVLRLTKVEGWEETDVPLVASFDVQVPDYASVVGRRLLLPVFLFHGKPMYAFTAATRQYPVYFPYTFSEIDTVSFAVPAGLTAESAPEEMDSHPAFASYKQTSQVNGQELLIQRNLTLSRMNFAPTDYSGLRDFFAVVKEGDGRQAVFQKPATAAEAAH